MEINIYTSKKVQNNVQLESNGYNLFSKTKLPLNGLDKKDNSPRTKALSVTRDGY